MLQIVNFRNRLVHAYDSIDDAIVWVIINKHLPELKNEVEKVRPDENELKRLGLKINEIINSINKKLKGKAVAVLGGSFAKNTVIKKDKYDADIFVRFSKQGNISEMLEKALKSLKFKTEKVPGSRDYFKTKVEDILVEIVPIIKIKKAEQAVNVTDVSPLHVIYIKNQINKKKSLADEIRLAKAFCYANNCYGAESHIRGFSGYCLEVLVSYYKSFLNLVKNSSKWPEEKKVVLDPEKYYNSKEEVLRELNESKLVSPLIIVDPVQKNRNVSAALSQEKFLLFIGICKKFLKNPSEKLFEKKDEAKEILNNAKKTKKELLIINTESLKDKEDIAGAKLLKFCNVLLLKLEKEGYTTKSAIVFSENSAKFYILLDKKDRIVDGPFIKMKEHVKSFKKRWKNTVIKGKRIYAIKKKSEIDWKKALKIEKRELKDMAVKKYSVKSLKN